MRAGGSGRRAGSGGEQPNPDDIEMLARYLGQIERAAAVLSPEPAPLTAYEYINKVLFPPPPQLDNRAERIKVHPSSLRALLFPEEPPFNAVETLPGDRVGRIAQLTVWLHRFPAFDWMSRNAVLESGLACFRRIQKRRRGEPLFADDLAEFRYWRLATWALRCLPANPKRRPSADQREQAIAAAKKLLYLAQVTALARESGVPAEEWQVFLGGLERVKSLAGIKRRKRYDTFSADRHYVELLAVGALTEFGDAPPALICELASLKVRNPDKVAITKQVSEFKRRRAAHRSKV